MSTKNNAVLVFQFPSYKWILFSWVYYQLWLCLWPWHRWQIKLQQWLQPLQWRPHLGNIRFNAKSQVFPHPEMYLLDIECKKDSPQLDNWKAESVDARRLGIQAAPPEVPRFEFPGSLLSCKAHSVTLPLGNYKSSWKNFSIGIKCNWAESGIYFRYR